MCALVAFAILAAAYRPLSFLDWLLENALVMLFLATLTLTYRRFALSDTSYVLLALFLCLHEWGAHYKYSDVPLGEWMKPWLHTTRNSFDRIVHFSYGLLCSYPLQELVMRTGVRNAWRSILPVGLILAFSAIYEILEGLMAVLVSPELSNDFSGLQGDVWDAQKDMSMAGLGSLVAVATIAWLRHRRSVTVTHHSMAMAAQAK